MMVKVVRVPMLPPSFSATTTTALAVGQMKQMNMPSSTSLVSASPPKRVMSKTMRAEMLARVSWMTKCQVRGRISEMLILQKVT